MYLVKSNILLRKLYPHRIWKKDTMGGKILYISFDDGPHETATVFALETLKRFNAKATFFCIGNNVEKHSDIYQNIIDEGHSVGNHTFNHVNGWKVDVTKYLEEIDTTYKLVKSNLFRPPYGRMTRQQENLFFQKYPEKEILMWDVLSGDFDINISGEKCLRNILGYAETGSVIVFHDSYKAWERMQYALPKTLEYFSEKGFRFDAL
ncbi:polysaccharide deacetylase family protein [Arachidicoccus soli]|uniref:Polysaccharide deacetylase family protein n=1 Tax=Arachidicoccus soli TaxID=2341117 RepID=A0A386HSQ4_9BACT|nr:polysaccharide deacetylase family protein [Arachidicoccus soli]AYD48977.1 polysaccharide deacetylase family protein [Arachidicoccus soli]